MFLVKKEAEKRRKALEIESWQNLAEKESASAES